MKPSRFSNLAICAIFFIGIAPGTCGASKTQMTVKVPVLDVRSEPHSTAQAGIHDPQQETQLLYGERIRVIEVRDGWAQIEALEQAEYTHKKRWQGYPGWVPATGLFPATAQSEPTIVITSKWAKIWKDPYKKDALNWQLPLGTTLNAVEFADQFWKIELVDGNFAWLDITDAFSLERLTLISPIEKRKRLIQSASQFLGDPYFWGGRSPRIDDPRIAASGVDCSGLVNLAYRSIGMAIPRDAHEQYLKAAPVEAPQPGDLIFLSENNNPKRIVHVMLYAGSGEILEAPATGKQVHRIPVTERFGQSLDFLASGSTVDGQTLYYGSFFAQKQRR